MRPNPQPKNPATMQAIPSQPWTWDDILEEQMARRRLAPNLAPRQTIKDKSQQECEFEKLIES